MRHLRILYITLVLEVVKEGLDLEHILVKIVFDTLYIA